MKADCVLAIGQVLGRQPSDADIRNVEGRIAKAMRQQATLDPGAWTAMPTDAQVRAGAQRAAADLTAEAGLKQQRRVLQVLAAAKVQQTLAAYPGKPLDALSHLIAFHTDVKGGMSVESRAKAIGRDGLRQILQTLEQSAPKFFGLLDNEAGTRDIVRELHGQKTGNADAAAGAKAFTDMAELMRQRFNAAGGDVGRLDDWGLPHHHSQIRVAKAGADKWIADTFPLLGRKKYIDEFGARMTDDQVREFLREAWPTIATGGANKMEPGKGGGSGMRANRGNESRQIHYADGDAFIKYQEMYGERTAYEVMVDHIQNLGTDIALVETFGPNPNQQYNLFRDRALKSESLADPVNVGNAETRAQRADNQYALLSGNTQAVANPRVAQFFDGLRNLQVASKLGSAVITAFTDEGTMRVAAHVANLPQMQLIRNELAAFDPTNQMERRMAHRAGLALNTLAHTMNRFGNEHLMSGWTAKAAQVTLRVSGMNAMTDARRRAYGVTMMSSIGAVVRDTPNLADLDVHDFRILASKGITEAEWAVWREATPENWGSGNDTMLTPDAIYRVPDAAIAKYGDPARLKEQAATRLLGTVLEETDVAVLEPGIREREIMGGNRQRGTFLGEITRSFLLFKSFPITMITRHWARAASMPTTGGTAAYAAALVASTTVLGMVAQQTAQIIQGRDPRDMTEWKTWVEALLKGGALSLFGDFLFADETTGGRSILAATAGPVASLAEESIALTIGNVHQAAEGKDTNAGAEALRLVKSNVPGANLWYTRAAVDHLILHQLQEYLSPGYLQRMESRARKTYGQEFYWAPGETMPERAPNLGAAIGAEP